MRRVNCHGAAALPPRVGFAPLTSITGVTGLRPLSPELSIQAINSGLRAVDQEHHRIYRITHPPQSTPLGSPIGAAPFARRPLSRAGLALLGHRLGVRVSLALLGDLLLELAEGARDGRERAELALGRAHLG